MGVRITPLLMVHEDIAARHLDNGPFRMGFEGSDRIDEILPVEPGSDRNEVSRWFAEGKLCFGVRDGERLIAKMWCDTESFHHPLDHHPLGKDAVYLYAACVLNEYRGRDIAVLMRSACCNALRENGFSRFYSCTFYFNYPARRFKEKLGCRNESLHLHINLFGRWARTWVLKRYT
jgi:GNAT superfamily N-acetyltransferase